MNDTESATRYTIILEKGGDRGQAEKLAKCLSTPVAERILEKVEGPVLRFTKEGLFFENGKMVLHGDFSAMSHRLENGRLLHEPLLKAVKLKDKDESLSIVDATAGLGEDSILLAAAGHNVTLIERDPIICALLKDAVRRGARVQGLKEAVSRMQVIEGNSIHVLAGLAERPDVILLDPMFPEKTNTALVKKKFQMIYLLERQASDEDELMKAAMNANPRKIVVKRPLKGPYLGGVRPGYSLEGKTIRYDCIVL